MADASSIRKAATLPVATGRNRGSIRFDNTNAVAVISNGTNWVPQNTFNVVVRHNANTSAVDEQIFIADRPCQVVAASEVHGTAGTDAGAVTLQIKKQTGTQLITAGTALLTNNTNAGFNLKSTINTVQVGTLNATLSNLQLATGDRLSLDYTGVTTALAGVTVSITMRYI